MGWATHLVFQQAKMDGGESQSHALNMRTLQVMWSRWSTSLIDRRIDRRNDALAFQFFKARAAQQSVFKWRSVAGLEKTLKHIQASCFRQAKLATRTYIYIYREREMCWGGGDDQPSRWRHHQ